MRHTCEVVIATRNRPDRLADCLASLGRQSMREFGVIVVDDCGDAPLDEVVERYPDLDIRLQRLPRQSGPAAARNHGAELVQAEYVAFIDDDVRAHPDLLATHLTAVRSLGEDGRPVVSCGPFVEPDEWDPTPWNKWEAVKAREQAADLEAGVYQVTWRQFYTGNNCMPIEAFRAAGGFDPAFKRAEDFELGLRLAEMGCEFRFESGAIAWHYPHRTLDSWLAIPRAYAVYDVHLDRIHPDFDYLQTVKREMGDRRAPMRAARWIFLRPGIAQLGVRLWVGVGRAAFRVGWNTLSVAALSAAYDLSYADALRRAEQAPDLETAEQIAWGS